MASMARNECHAMGKYQTMGHTYGSWQSLRAQIPLSVVCHTDMPDAQIAGLMMIMVESDLIPHVALVFEQQRGAAN